jgi:copper chaperone
MRTTYEVKGMMCHGCANLVRLTAEDFPGVNTVEVDLATGTLALDHDDAFHEDALKDAFKPHGYTLERRV